MKNFFFPGSGSDSFILALYQASRHLVSIAEKSRFIRFSQLKTECPGAIKGYSRAFRLTRNRCARV